MMPFYSIAGVLLDSNEIKIAAWQSHLQLTDMSHLLLIGLVASSEVILVEHASFSCPSKLLGDEGESNFKFFERACVIL